jgi:thioredoxin 1
MLRMKNEEVETFISSTHKPVILYFYSVGCDPCKYISPILEEIAEEYSDQLSIIKLNAREAGEVVSPIAVEYRVVAVPTTIFLKNGVVTERKVGRGSKSEFEDVIKKSFFNENY